MTAAIQRQTDVELELFSSSGDPEPLPSTPAAGSASQKGSSGITSSGTGGQHNNNGTTSLVLARVKVQGLSSQPVDHEEASERLKSLTAGLGDHPGTLTLDSKLPSIKLKSHVTRKEDMFGRG